MYFRKASSQSSVGQMQGLSLHGAQWNQAKAMMFYNIIHFNFRLRQQWTFYPFLIFDILVNHYTSETYSLVNFNVLIFVYTVPKVTVSCFRPQSFFKQLLLILLDIPQNDFDVFQMFAEIFQFKIDSPMYCIY